MTKRIVEPVTIEIQRKTVKRLWLKINVHTGQLLVVAPFNMSEQLINEFIHSKRHWINQHTQQVAKLEPLQFIEGEYHYFMGRKYPLSVITADKDNGIIYDTHSLIMKIFSGAPYAAKLKLMNNWYRYELKKRVPALINYWQKTMDIPKVEWRIKKMKTRWGTCNASAERIWLNLELAKKHESCLEYVIVHELVHFFERYHNSAFYTYMDKFLPEWKLINKQLHSVSQG